MNPIKENLMLPAPVEELIQKAFDQKYTLDQRQPYRARMVAIASTLTKAIEIFDKQKA